MRLEEAVEILPAEGGEELLVMELAEGTETAVDGFARDGKVLLAHPKVQGRVQGQPGHVLRDARLARTSTRWREKIVAGLGLDHFFSVNVVGEVADRDQPAHLHLGLPGGREHALARASGTRSASSPTRTSPSIELRIRPSRRALRYFDQVEWDE